VGEDGLTFGPSGAGGAGGGEGAIEYDEEVR
jgi:hypothetical protein